jgi:hypothetical protein
MQYWKNKENEIVLSVNTVNDGTGGNVTEEEYEYLKRMFYDMPQGKQIHDNGDGTYEYEDAPEPPEDEPTAEEVLAILTGEAE